MRQQKKDEKCNKDIKKLQEICFKNCLGFMIVKTHLGGLTLNTFYLLFLPDIPPSSWLLMKLFQMELHLLIQHKLNHICQVMNIKKN